MTVILYLAESDVIKYASLTVTEKWQWKLYLAESDVIKYASLTVIKKWQ